MTTTEVKPARLTSGQVARRRRAAALRRNFAMFRRSRSGMAGLVLLLAFIAIYMA